MKKITRDEKVTVKGVELIVKQTYYYDESLDMYYDDIELGNNNLREIRNAYRKYAGLLTDEEIKEIRDEYIVAIKD